MTQTTVSAIVSGACVIAAVPAWMRWLRVAQREHYLPDATSRFALRWWLSSPVNITLILVGCAGVALSSRFALAALASAAVAVAGPAGLSIRGRTSPLAWTRRLKTLATVSAVAGMAIIYLGIAVGHPPLAGAAIDIGACVMVDLACYLTYPLEKKLAERYVKSARERLEKVKPRVVAITGSYGKTSTKLYTAHLSAGCYMTMPSPASFNNRAGLARAINEHLLDSTEVFVAEMGTYGPGEIRELCSWLVPDISVITAIGPVHLERFKSEDRILQAKLEITESASTIVLQVDDPRLAALARQLEVKGKRVIRCSSHAATDGAIHVEALKNEVTGTIQVNIDSGEVAAGVVTDAQPSNIGLAVGAALALGCPKDIIAERLHTLTSPSHRLERIVSEGHPTVLDDTYNSNPAGCMAALARLRYDHATGRKVLVTPGMVELGPIQHKENTAFARAAADVADLIIVVGRTNRKALLKGIAAAADLEEQPGVTGSTGQGGIAESGRQESRVPKVITAGNRDKAVGWIRNNLNEQDIVLYENDLPDHYP